MKGNFTPDFGPKFSRCWAKYTKSGGFFKKGDFYPSNVSLIFVITRSEEALVLPSVHSVILLIKKQKKLTLCTEPVLGQVIVETTILKALDILIDFLTLSKPYYLEK